MGTYYGTSGNDYIDPLDPANDIIYGSAGNDTLYGWSGNDTIYGESGNDILYGESGNDVLNGGTDNDTMYGGTGNDIYYVDTMSDIVTEYANAGIDLVYSSVSTNYKWLPANVENLTLTGTAYYGDGNDLNNVIQGTNSGNSLYGYGGNDTLYGYGGNDYLTGGTGSDTLIGGSGNDSLNGYGGTTGEYDILSGDYSSSQPGVKDSSDGADTFILGDASKAYYLGSGYATITDFYWSEGDKIQVHGSQSNYSLSFQNWSGSSANDTLIYSNSDLIGVVQDTTNVILSADFIFV